MNFAYEKVESAEIIFWKGRLLIFALFCLVVFPVSLTAGGPDPTVGQTLAKDARSGGSGQETPEDDIPWPLMGVVLGGLLSANVAVFLWNLRLQGKMAGAILDIKEKKRQLEHSREEILRSEKRFRLVFQNAPYSMVITRLEDGQILDANKAFLKSRGINEEDMGRINTKDFVRTSKEERGAIIETLKRRGAVHGALAAVTHTDGSPGQVIYSSVLLDVEGEAQALSMAVDVTETLRVREALEKGEKKFQDMFNNAPIGIFRTTYGGLLVEANATLARLLGFGSREDLLTLVQDLSTDIYPTPSERQRLLDALALSPGGVRMEIEFKRRDGSPLYAVINAAMQNDEAGNPAWLNGSIEDITGLRQAELETRKLAAAVEQSGDMIVITDPNGVIQYVNPAFERITGYCRQEALGQRPSILKSGKHDPAFYEKLWRSITRGKTWKGRIVNQRKDGTLFTEQAAISPLFDANGGIVNFVATKRDITDELALKEQNRQMQKMEAIGRLTGGVAHDFNNLLQVMNGFTEMALMDLPPGHRSLQYLEQALLAGGRAAGLVKQLLLFSRRQIMNPSILDLNAEAADFLKMVGRIIGDHIRIDWAPCADALIINADSGMLDQVLMNLCVNARDAMPMGGVLSVSTRSKEFDEAFCAHHAWAKPGRFAQLTVSDTGGGMDEITMERIFEPFFTTKEEGKGTGLGLATAYGIVNQHGGMLDAYSELDHGTEFKIYLPLVEQRKERADAAPVNEAAGGDETILIAEDDAMVRELACSFLRRAGYTVLEAMDGQDAVDLFTKNSGMIALVVLDVMMPTLNGYAAYERIRKIRPGVAVLFCSAFSEDGIHTDFVLKEGLSFVQKPYSRHALLSAVRAALD